MRAELSKCTFPSELRDSENEIMLNFSLRVNSLVKHSSLFLAGLNTFNITPLFGNLKNTKISASRTDPEASLTLYFKGDVF